MSGMSERAIELVTAALAARGIPATDADAFNAAMSALLEGKPIFETERQGDAMSDATMTFEATQDDDAWQDDPRDWDNGPKLTARYRVPRHGIADDFGDVVPELAAFRHAYAATGDDDLALRAANHYAGVYGTGRTVTRMTITGYSQSEWCDVVTVDEADAATFAQWFRGDVWTVTMSSHAACELGQDHATVVESCGGIYADDADAAIAYFRAEYVGVEA